MARTGSNSAKQKYRYGSASAANEEIWTGHAADHDALHSATAGVFGVTWVIGAEAGDVINVGIQLNDIDGIALAEVAVVEAFLSDAVTGIGISAAAPDVDAVIGTDGAFIVVHTTDLAWLVQSEADGDIDIDINDTTGTPTWYMVVILFDGTLAVSPAITFA